MDHDVYTEDYTYDQDDYVVKTHPQHLEDEVEKERILRSIRYLASHVPTAVLKRLTEETKTLRDFKVAPPFLTKEIVHQYYPTVAGHNSQELCCAGSIIETNSEVSDVSELSYHSEENQRNEKLMDQQPPVEFLLDDDLALAMLIEEEGGNDDSPDLGEKLDASQHGETPVVPPDGDHVVAEDNYGKAQNERENEEADSVAIIETLHDASVLPENDKKIMDDHIIIPLSSNYHLHQHQDDGEEDHPAPERPKRRQRAPRRSSLASQVSILSHRYFENAATLPYASKHDSALLFVDISGFTRLSTLLSPEDLSRAINEYFQLIVNEVIHHNGDILKFAGDAVFAEWKVRSNRSIMFKSSIEANVRMNMEDCVTSAAICAAKIVSKYSNHRIEAHHTNGNDASADGSPLTLNVHCGISIGELVSVHVGDNESRREYLVMGQPIQDVAEAEGCAALGEVAACVAAVRALSRTCELHDSLQPWQLTGPVVIANQSEAFFTPVDGYTERYASDAAEGDWACKVGRLLDGWAIEELVQFRRLLSLYVHPVVIYNDKANFDQTQSSLEVESRQLQEAELRNVFVMFIAPTLAMSVTGDEVLDTDRLQLLNSIMNLTTAELDRFGGHLRQYIVDDKGLVLIATFGLRGSTFPNMVAERALPTAQRIQEMLLSDLKLSCRIGCTTGSAYCGVVGGVMRHEYAVLGPSVNLAARLMCSSKNPGILVSDDVRKVTGKSFSFQALGSVKAKGYAKPIYIYEPLSAKKKALGGLKTSFVGREDELKKIKELALGLSQSPLPSARLVIIFGESGLGKSTLMMHGIEQVRRKMDRTKKRMLVLSQVCNERDGLTPFGSFGPVLLAVLSTSQNNNQHTASTSARSTESVISGSSRSLSTRSFQSGSSTGVNSKCVIVERLCALCKQLNAPAEFAELVGHHLLQVDLSSYLEMSRSTNQMAAAKSKKPLAEFMAEMFQHCTRELDLVVIAVDDIHLADELSWRVIQEIFLSASNCLIMCTCRPLTQNKLTIDPVFWGELQIDHATTGKYTAINLKRLSKLETTEMIAKTMGISNERVDEHMQRRVFYQSWGIPQFVNVLLESMKKAELTIEESSFDEDDEECEEESKSAVSYHSSENIPSYLGQLLLQRIDTFSGSSRNVLNLAATLGLSFQLKELIAILVNSAGDSHAASKETYELAKSSAREALDAAVEEGIMYVRFCGEECEEPEVPMSVSGVVPVDFSYFFTHDVWRAAILKLVLDKRKRQLHEAIASTLESNVNDSVDDFVSQIRVFNHWKQSGNAIKAGGIALIIGKTYESLGLAVQSAQLYKEAISVITQAPCDQLEVSIKLHVAAGRALASTFRYAESVPEYKRALKILEDAPIDYHFPDRSVVFPIFSGLFLLLKGVALPQDAECSYEQRLVVQYVAETKLHGDPIHYARSLAMQAETMAKLGKFESALSANYRLRGFYEPKLHSEGICNAYGSDRAAQSISLSTAWLLEVGKEKEALETCDLVIHELLPEMDIHNVHNSFMILIPIVLMLENRGDPSMAYKLFKEYVVDPFETYFGEGGSTPLRCMHRPILMLYDLQANREGKLLNFKNYLRWALCAENLRFGATKNVSSLSFGCLYDVVPAKICLLLAKRSDCERDQKKKLVALSRAVCRDALALATSAKSGPCTRSAKSLLRSIEEYELLLL